MRTRSRLSSVAGFSLPELVTTVAILGVLSGIAIVSYSGIHVAAREGVARDTVGLLNRAVLHFDQANWDMPVAADSTSASDELTVLRALQWRDPNDKKATPGSPYISPRFSDATTSSVSEFRIRWNGTAFELLIPGETGSGLKTGAAAAESANEYVFGDGYQPPTPSQNE